MPYIAQKPCRFDKAYQIGMVIPDSAVDPKREKDLIAMKIVAKIPSPAVQEGTPGPDIAKEDEDTPAADAAQEGAKKKTRSK